ncbi:MAG: threonine--tRNA ligase [Candidatus Berkelbacteria bacterium]|nr:threonine--tRNA ligase [Candidatus Berkelbacteria bacterium]
MSGKKINLEVKCHSLSHILAAAVIEMFPEGELGIGPSIENGFYYDFDLPRTLIPEDLPLIEEKMRALIKKNLKFEKAEMAIDEAIKKAKDSKHHLKLELLEDLKKEGNKTVSFYKTGDFVDLCKGPHVASTQDLKAVTFKLDRISGAYWKGDEKNKMLQRIYALAFETEEHLRKFIENREKAQLRDHRRLGARLGLFTFHEEAPGMAFFHAKGTVIFNLLVERWRKIQKEHGYQEVRLPDLLDVKLWKQSGHFDHYKDDMFFVEGDNKTLALRPMDCPGAILLYKEGVRSYNDLPMRVSELGTVYRNEKSGELHGLFRVQQMTQDDAHIFIAEEMIEDEVGEVIKILEKIYAPFDMEREIYLATRPDDAMGDEKVWEKAENALGSALKKSKIKYGIKEKDGAFYGPKIDIHINDSLGRTWQMGTIQLDFFMPERFGLEYVARDGSLKRPVMIHRALMGSLERFIGIITEHYAGAFPVWLAPVQAVVLPISDKHNVYAQKIADKLKKLDIRAEAGLKSETIGRKIRDAELKKIPYMIVVGDKEIAENKISIRKLGEGDKGQNSVEALVAEIKGSK